MIREEDRSDWLLDLADARAGVLPADLDGGFRAAPERFAGPDFLADLAARFAVAAGFGAGRDFFADFFSGFAEGFWAGMGSIVSVSMMGAGARGPGRRPFWLVLPPSCCLPEFECGLLPLCAARIRFPFASAAGSYEMFRVGPGSVWSEGNTKMLFRE